MSEESPAIGHMTWHEIDRAKRPRTTLIRAEGFAFFRS